MTLYVSLSTRVFTLILVLSYKVYTIKSFQSISYITVSGTRTVREPPLSRIGDVSGVAFHQLWSPTVPGSCLRLDGRTIEEGRRKTEFEEEVVVEEVFGRVLGLSKGTGG